ncbi:MAG TPA: response regulator [Polyangiales bacterium]|nr:response regulator [Polyangiales bacterium]
MDHLLLVEDEAALRNSLLRCLQGTPELDLRAVATLQEAVVALDAKPPHLVVLDLELPDGSGLDLVPELALRGLNVPVVVITAHLQRFQPQLPERSNLEILQKPSRRGSSAGSRSRPAGATPSRAMVCAWPAPSAEKRVCSGRVWRKTACLSPPPRACQW